jgi:hypothetical protein
MADEIDALSNPSFLPLQGQLFSTTTYTYSTLNQDWQPQGETIDEHHLGTSNHYDERLEYGLTDRLAVGVDGGYASASGQYVYFDGPKLDANSSGLSNFALNAYYQAITYAHSPFSVYIEGTYAPGVVANAPRSEGLNLFVNRNFELATDHGVMGLTLQGEAGTAYDDDYASTNPQSGLTTHISGRWTYLFAGRSQFRFSPRWAFNSGVQFRQLLANSVAPPQASSIYSNSSESAVEPYVNVAYNIVPNRATVAIEYEHDFIGDERHLGGLDSGAWVNQSQNLYSIRLFLLF